MRTAAGASGSGARRGGGWRLWAVLGLVAPLLIGVPVGAATSSVQIIDQFGTAGWDYVEGVAVDGFGNVIVAGYADGALPGQTAAGGYDGFVRKYDTAGGVLWTAQFGSAGGDLVEGVAVDGSGHIYVAGATTGTLPGQTSAGGLDGFVRKYDAAGGVRWTDQFGTVGWDFVEGVVVDGSGNVIVAGRTEGTLPGQTPAGGYDGFVRKYDAAGVVLWTAQFGTVGGDAVNGVAVDGSGHIYVAGSTGGTLPGETSAGGYDGFVRKYDAAGGVRWTDQFGSVDVDVVYGVAVDGSGNVIVAGRTEGTLPGQTSAGGYDGFVRKYDAAGVVQWTDQFGTAGLDDVSGVTADGSGNIYVGGSTNGTLPRQTSAGGYDGFVRRYRAWGELRWTHQFGTANDEDVTGVAADGSGNIYVGGYTNGTLSGQTTAGLGDGFLAVIPGQVPDAPTGASATAGDRQATVVWTAPVDSGSSPIVSYTVTADPGGATVTVPGSARTATVHGLANHTTYTFTVVATNAIGDSPPSAPSNPVTPTGPPTIDVLGGTTAVSDAVIADLQTLTGVTPLRLAGPERTTTACEVVTDAFPGTVDVVYLATAYNFPDALAGSAAAAVDGAPVLLVAPDAVPDCVADQLHRLAPKQVKVLGGPTAISDPVLDHLHALTGVVPVRLAGPDRYATAAAIVADAFPGTVATVYIATGTNFPDALAGSAAAAAKHAPVLLVTPTDLPPETADQLQRLSPTHINVLGGPTAIPDPVLDQIHALTGVAPERLAGPDRYATAAAIVADAFPGTVATVYIATGTNFPDALAGSAAAAAKHAPVLLVTPDTIPDPAATQITRLLTP
jgi:putative cell wall-binding protein